MMNTAKWLGLMILTSVIVTACTGSGGFDYSRIEDDMHGAIISPPRKIDDFSMPSTTGADFSMADQRGKVVLIYFGYLTCPDVCPATFGDLRRVYTEVGAPKDKVTVVFVTVDPKRDSLEKMGVYLAAFHEDFIGLRTDDEALQTVMESFGARATFVPVNPNEPDGDYSVEHSASIFVIGPDGHLLTQFMYGTPYRDLAHDMGLIMEEMNR